MKNFVSQPHLAPTLCQGHMWQNFLTRVRAYMVFYRERHYKFFPTLRKFGRKIWGGESLLERLKENIIFLRVELSVIKKEKLSRKFEKKGFVDEMWRVCE